MLPPVAYPPCSWSTDGEPCRYPATMTAASQATSETQWFCSLHFGLTDLQRGADIVRASRDYVHRPAGADVEQLQREAAAYCQQHGLRSVKHMRDFVRSQLRSRAAPSSTWAQKIRDRSASGEELPLISLQMADEVLGVRAVDLAGDAPAVDPAESVAADTWNTDSAEEAAMTTESDGNFGGGGDL